MIKNFFLYGIIGSFSAGLDTLVFYFLRLYDWNLYITNFISINLGITCSFLMNAFLNFKITDKIFKRATRFFTIGYCGLSMSMFIMYLGVDVMQFRDIIVKIISGFIIALFQFLLNKFITFRRTANG